MANEIDCTFVMLYTLKESLFSLLTLKNYGIFVTNVTNVSNVTNVIN